MGDFLINWFFRTLTLTQILRNTIFSGTKTRISQKIDVRILFLSVGMYFFSWVYSIWQILPNVRTVFHCVPKLHCKYLQCGGFFLYKNWTRVRNKREIVPQLFFFPDSFCCPLFVIHLFKAKGRLNVWKLLTFEQKIVYWL